MALEVLTKEDLQQFKVELFTELKAVLKTEQLVINKKWLRSNEVRKMLNISPGTLQNLRINRTLKPNRVGGILYYDSHEIESMLQGAKHFRS